MEKLEMRLLGQIDCLVEVVSRIK